ncbi:hypothetical protein GY45DRAFT_330663 [Cubamyces sp. BRFM 1775]|nr:hypothetical protein GY45DRAFT_330663 [Cubamyces sp. BRFM 1775]
MHRPRQQRTACAQRAPRNRRHPTGAKTEDLRMTLNGLFQRLHAREWVRHCRLHSTLVSTPYSFYCYLHGEYQKISPRSPHNSVRDSHRGRTIQKMPLIAAQILSFKGS